MAKKTGISFGKRIEFSGEAKMRMTQRGYRGDEVEAVVWFGDRVHDEGRHDRDDRYSGTERFWWTARTKISQQLMRLHGVPTSVVEKSKGLRVVGVEYEALILIVTLLPKNAKYEYKPRKRRKSYV